MDILDSIADKTVEVIKKEFKRNGLKHSRPLVYHILKLAKLSSANDKFLIAEEKRLNLN